MSTIVLNVGQDIPTCEHGKNKMILGIVLESV